MTRTLAAGIAIQACLFVAVGLVVLDMRAHHRVERLGGVNVWGYRGDVMGQKRTNEIRIAVVGGDLAYGWGVAAAETLAMYVRRRVSLYVTGSVERQREVTAVNIAGRGLTPGEYAAWIDRFAYLKIDVVCLIPEPAGFFPTATHACSRRAGIHRYCLSCCARKPPSADSRCCALSPRSLKRRICRMPGRSMRRSRMNQQSHPRSARASEPRPWVWSSSGQPPPRPRPDGSRPAIPWCRS